MDVINNNYQGSAATFRSKMEHMPQAVSELMARHEQTFYVIVKSHLLKVADMSVSSITDPTLHCERVTRSISSGTGATGSGSATGGGPTASARKKLRNLKRKDHGSGGGSSSASNLDSRRMLDDHTMHRLLLIINHLASNPNVGTEGLFRKSGLQTRQQELKARLLARDGRVWTPAEDLATPYTVHDLANVLKSVLGDIHQHEPLLTKAHYDIHCRLQHEKDRYKKVKTLQLLFLLLPDENYRLLRALLMLLHHVASGPARSSTRMDAKNLGVIFAPTIMVPKSFTPAQFYLDSDSAIAETSFMIQNARELFLVPSDVLKDVEDNLDRIKLKPVTQSSSDLVTTSWRCVEPVDDAVTDEVTDLALAELAAHVSSLPPGPVRDKFMKQFKKQQKLDAQHQLAAPGGAAEVLPHSAHKRRHATDWSVLKKFTSRVKGSNGDKVQSSTEDKENPQEAASALWYSPRLLQTPPRATAATRVYVRPAAALPPQSPAAASPRVTVRRHASHAGTTTSSRPPRSVIRKPPRPSLLASGARSGGTPATVRRVGKGTTSGGSKSGTPSGSGSGTPVGSGSGTPVGSGSGTPAGGGIRTPRTPRFTSKASIDLLVPMPETDSAADTIDLSLNSTPSPAVSGRSCGSPGAALTPKASADELIKRRKLCLGQQGSPHINKVLTQLNTPAGTGASPLTRSMKKASSAIKEAAHQPRSRLPIYVDDASKQTHF